MASLLEQKPESESVETFVGRQSPEIREAFDALKSQGEDVPAVTGDELIGIFNAASGAITFSSLSPNPAQSQAVLRYRLGAIRTVMPALYDVRGALVRVLGNPTLQEGGEYRYKIDLKDIPPGMYLLVIGTDKGERVIQRLIVQ